MWQELRNELHPAGLEVVTVGLDAAGPDACRPFIEAAAPEHPSLIDQHHQVARLFGVANIPNGVWIDEDGAIVRPAEPAPAPRRDLRNRLEGVELPERVQQIMAEAAKIEANPEAYEAALRDWVANGADSEFALSPEEVLARSQPQDAEIERGHERFDRATHLVANGQHDEAVEEFRQAHALVPQNFAYRRQAWSLVPSIPGPLARFWQGPAPDAEDEWPYEGDWPTDAREMGAENYYPEWKP